MAWNVSAAEVGWALQRSSKEAKKCEERSPNFRGGAGMSKKFYSDTSLSPPFTMTSYKNRLITYKGSSPLLSKMTAIVKLWRYSCPPDQSNYFTPYRSVLKGEYHEI